MKHNLSGMDAETLSRELEARGLSRQVKAAAALRVNQATVSRWLAGETPIPGWVELALKAIRAKGGAK